jgi:biopolymer transport protein ExbB
MSMMLKQRIGRGTCRSVTWGLLCLGLVASAATARADVASPGGEAGTIVVQRRIARVVGEVLVWYEQTPAGERIAWGGLAACAVLGLLVLAERAARLRRRAVVPRDFTARFLDRLHEGKLDGGKALDYCEMNPSPAARVALAAVRRWGRPAIELERAVGLAHRWESERLRSNVGTLRRITALAPLLGLLGTLLAFDRILTGAGDGSLAWSALAEALRPSIAGLGVATASLVAYDLMMSRIERLGGALDRLGAETIDAIAMTTSSTLPNFPPAPHVRIAGVSPPVPRRAPGAGL